MSKQKMRDIYKVFANKNRVKLIVCLSREKSVTELLEYCMLSQSALSQHLKILKDEGVALCTRDGKKQLYHVKDKKILKLAQLLLELE
jgi:ArsR family transcriptional regulator, virulence genes transcriptional regulator